MKVLSLFDGISCGRIALERIGINIDKYYASEISETAIKCSEDNYKDIIRLGDITKWKEWNIDFSKIDLVIGGSPCQGFSFAGKQLNFNDERSKLFFEFIEILNFIKLKNPNVKFLLENVKMKKEFETIITDFMKIEPIIINSKLVSAQMRKRLYWTNIKNVCQPKDKKILLENIITDGFVEKEKSFCLLEGESRPHSDNYKRYLRYKNKSFVTIVYTTKDKDPKKNRILNQLELERLQTVPEGYTKSLTRNQAASVLGNGWTIDVIAHIFKELK